MNRKCNFIILLVCCLSLWTAVANAQSAGLLFEESEMEELRQLREKDHQLFQEKMEKRREQVRQELLAQKKDNPKKYKEKVAASASRIKFRLGVLKFENDKWYENFLKRHIAQERRWLLLLRRKDQKQFDQVLEDKQDRFNARVARFKWLKSEEYARFMEKNSEKIDELKKRRAQRQKRQERRQQGQTDTEIKIYHQQWGRKGGLFEQLQRKKENQKKEEDRLEKYKRLKAEELIKQQEARKKRQLQKNSKQNRGSK